jgi:hypothetical protein
MNSQESEILFQETIEYLSEIGSTSYAPFVRSIDSNIPSIDDQGVNVNPLKAVTAARPALLPMIISTSTPSNNGNDKRVEFTMLINPENINFGKTNTISSSYTRLGWVTQLWGPNQDLLTGTGKSAAFMVEGSGLTNFLKRRSVGFQNFMALLKTYRNNGYDMVDPTKLKTLTRVISLIRGVEIAYDNQVFLGHFNNFTLDENAEAPFVFNYNFEFVVSSNSRDSSEIRGHYRKIPENVNNKDTDKNNPVLMGDIIGKEESSFFGSIKGFLEA